MPNFSTSSHCGQCAVSQGCLLGEIWCRMPEASRPPIQVQFFKPGQSLQQVDQQAECLSVVKTGMVMVGQHLRNGEELSMALVGRGHVLGARAATSQGALFWGRAQSEGALCSMRFDQMGEDFIASVRNLLPAFYVSQLMALTHWTRLLRTTSLRQRVEAALTLMWELQGASGRRILLPKQATMAALLNTTRESLGRVLSEIEAAGLLKRIDRSRVELAMDLCRQ